MGLPCDPLSTSDFGDVTRLVHGGVYRNGNTYIELDMPVSAQVDIKLYDILGKEIGTVANEMLFSGRHSFLVKDRLRRRLSYGQYIYRIGTGGQFYSKQIIIQ